MHKINYLGVLDNDTGTLYTQSVSMSMKDFEDLEGKVLNEVKLDYPQAYSYSSSKGYAQVYLKPLKLNKERIAYLTPTEVRFVNLSLKLKLKTDRNTCIIIK